MSEGQLSKNYEHFLRDEEEKAKESGDSSVVDAIRQGFKMAGVLTSEVYVLNLDAGAGKGTDALVTGVYQRSSGKIGLLDIDGLKRTGSVASGIAGRVAAILKHEKRHKTSHLNAKDRGEAGIIAGALGAKHEETLQEHMAGGSEVTSQGSVEALCAQIGMKAKDVAGLLYKGQEEKIVRAAEKSGNVEIKYAA